MKHIKEYKIFENKYEYDFSLIKDLFIEYVDKYDMEDELLPGYYGLFYHLSNNIFNSSVLISVDIIPKSFAEGYWKSPSTEDTIKGILNDVMSNFKKRIESIGYNFTLTNHINDDNYLYDWFSMTITFPETENESKVFESIDEEMDNIKDLCVDMSDEGYCIEIQNVAGSPGNFVFSSAYNRRWGKYKLALVITSSNDPYQPEPAGRATLLGSSSTIRVRNKFKYDKGIIDRLISNIDDLDKVDYYGYVDGVNFYICRKIEDPKEGDILTTINITFWSPIKVQRIIPIWELSLLNPLS